MEQILTIVAQRITIAVFWFITLVLLLCLFAALIQWIGYIFNADLLDYVGLNLDQVLNIGFYLTIAIIILPFVVPKRIRFGYLDVLLTRVDPREQK